MKLVPATLQGGQIVVYEYGVRLNKESIVSATEQISKARKLYNLLVACIRTTVFELQADALLHAGDQGRVISAKLQQLNEAFSSAKSRQDEAAMRQVGLDRREQLRLLRQHLKIIYKDCKKDHEIRFFSRIGKKTTCETYQLRCAAVAEGLGWGTANAMLESALTAFKKSFQRGQAPRFASAANRIQDSLTLQFPRANSASTVTFLNGNNAELKLLPSNGCGRRKYGEFSFRLGPAADNIYASGTWQYHRPLPDDATVGVARLLRRRIGKDYRWYVQLQVKLAEPISLQFEQRRPLVAVHFGQAADISSSRVAAVANSTNPSDAYLIALPPEIEEKLKRAAALQSTRAVLRDQLVPKLKIEAIAGLDSSANQELNHILQSPIHQIALSRLHRFCQRLQEQQLSPQWMTLWRKQDRQLWQASAHLARRARNTRRDFYRTTALDIASRYSSVVIELASAPAASEAGNREAPANNQRSSRNAVAIYEFESALRWACTKSATALLELRENNAYICAFCEGTAVTEKDLDRLNCSDCGVELDRKLNGAAMAYRQVSPLYELAVEEFFTHAAKQQTTRDETRLAKLQKMSAARTKNRRPVQTDPK